MDGLGNVERTDGNALSDRYLFDGHLPTICRDQSARCKTSSEILLLDALAWFMGGIFLADVISMLVLDATSS